MHAAIIIDEERLTHEHAMLRRLCIGLIDHGMMLTRIIPETLRSEAAAESEDRIALAARIRSPMKVLPWWRRARAERIAESLERSPPDVIYAIGREAWALGMDLAEAIGPDGRPLALNVWSPKLIRVVPRSSSRVRGAQHISAYIAASAPIAEELSTRVDPGLVSLVPMGAPVRDKPCSIFQSYPDAVSLAIVGACEDVHAYDALLGGIERIVRDPPEYPGLHIALELRGARCHDVWRIARRMDLLPFISALDDAAQHRALLTQCDAMLLPERRGELTSLLLEAMAGGMPVIAREDPYLDVIEDGNTGFVVKSDTVDEWTSALRRLLADPATSRRIGLQARERIRQTHSSAEQVRRLATTLEWITGSGAYRFEGIG